MNRLESLVFLCFVTSLVPILLWVLCYLAPSKTISLLGLGFDFFGTVILLTGILAQHMNAFRISKTVLVQERAVPTRWIERIAPSLLTYPVSKVNKKSTRHQHDW